MMVRKLHQAWKLHVQHQKHGQKEDKHTSLVPSSGSGIATFAPDAPLVHLRNRRSSWQR